jgi:sec-independent protein translocase protein TatA
LTLFSRHGYDESAEVFQGGEKMGPLGIPETIFIFVLALLMFGPKKLPELGKTLGKAMGEFKRASSELKETFEREMQTIERETESLKIDTHKYTNEIYNYDSYYDSGAYGSESNENTAHVPSTVSASAPQGAESPANTVAHGSEAASTTNGTPQTAETVASNGTAHPASSPESTPVKS